MQCGSLTDFGVCHIYKDLQECHSTVLGFERLTTTRNSITDKREQIGSTGIDRLRKK